MVLLILTKEDLIHFLQEGLKCDGIIGSNDIDNLLDYKYINPTQLKITLITF